jgi:predicted DNA-binding protein YlxM (UPF0122 family)
MSDVDLKLCVLAGVASGDELTCNEIAQFCDISKQAVQQMEKRALKKFQNELEATYYEHFSKKAYTSKTKRNYIRNIK